MEVCIKIAKDDVTAIHSALVNNVKVNEIKEYDIIDYKIVNVKCEVAGENDPVPLRDVVDYFLRQIENCEAYSALVENKNHNRVAFGYIKEIGWWVVFAAPLEELHAPDDPVGVVFQALGGVDLASKYEVVNGPVNWWQEESGK